MSRPIHRLWIWLIVGLAAAVRLWGIGFGLPHTWARPDESRVVGLAMRLGSGDLNPHMFDYPSLYIYVLFGLYVAYYATGRAIGRFHGLADFVQEYGADPTTFYLIDRGLTALLGTATVYLVYRVAARVYGHRAGLWSALFLALAHLSVRDAHFGVTDTAMGCLTMWAVLFVVEAHQSQRLAPILIASTLAGLTTSTKYGGAFLSVPIAVSAVLSGRPRRLPLCGVVFTLAFIAGTPFSVLDAGTFAGDFQYAALRLTRVDAITERGWWHHLVFTLRYGVGLPLLIAGILGLALSFRRRWRDAAVLFAFPIAYYLVTGSGTRIFARYMVPVVPFLCIGASAAVEWAAEVVAERFRRPRLAGLLAGAVALLVVASSAWSTFQSDRLLARRDNRLIASDWIRASVPPGSSIYQNATEGRLQLNPGQFMLEKLHKYADSIDAGMADATRRSETARAAQALAAAKVFDEWTYDPDRQTFMRDGIPVDSLPDIVVREESAFSLYEDERPDLSGVVERHYRLLKTFRVFDPANPANRFDQNDLLHLPFAGFHDVERPGPNLYVYILTAGSR